MPEKARNNQELLDALEIYNAVKLGFIVNLEDVPGYILEVCRVIEEEQAQHLKDEMEKQKIKSRL